MGDQAAGATAGAPGAAGAPPAGPNVDPVQAAADAAQAAAKAGETPPPAPPGDAPLADPPPPGGGRESALLRSIQQRERTLVTKQNELAARERQLTESVEQRVARAVEERLASFKSDPIAQLKALGLDEQTIASRLLNQGKQTPEEAAAQALKAANDLKAQLEQRDRQTAAQRAEENFATEATNAERYPHLNDEWTRPEMIREAHAVVSQLRARGIDPSQYSFADIAKHLDRVAKSRGDRREKLKAERTQKTSTQVEPKAEGNGNPGQGGNSGKPATTTTLGKNLGGRESLNGKAGHLLSDAELAAAVDAQVAPIRAALRSAS